MDTASTFGLQDLITSVAGDAAAAVSERAGESEQNRDDRAQAALGAIEAFLPCDAVEAMLASHCVMFHELIVADVRQTLYHEDAATRRATRSGIVALDKAFGDNLMRLKHHRKARLQEPEPAEDRTELEIADRILRHQSQIESGTNAVVSDAFDPVQSEAGATTETWPTKAPIAGLNRQARRALDRQSRKRTSGFARSGVTPDRNEPTATTSATSAG